MDVLELIEKGEVFIAVGGIEESQKIPFLKELLRLVKLGKRMQWVNIKESENPEEEREYWCCDSRYGIQFKGYWKRGKWEVISSELGSAFLYPTHYMPIPPNPGEGE